MNVWLSSRKNRGKTTYHLRWKHGGKWKSKAAGTDKKKAERRAALLEDQIQRGEYREIVKTPWQEFVDDHVSKVVGTARAYDTRLVLEDFGRVCSPGRVDEVEFPAVERYAAELRKRGLASTTLNKKAQILKRAFKMAIKRGVAVRNPMDEWEWDKVPKPEIRTLKPAEEALLASTARELYGLPMEAFIHIGIRLGARISELVALKWSSVDFEGRTVLFTGTKTGEDRRVPFGDSVASMLLKLKAQTLAAGGPWRANTRQQITAWWDVVRGKVGLEDVTIHDMRRTFCTRLFNVGTPPKTVMQLAGHKKLATTVKYYTQVGEADMREAIERLAKSG